MVKTVEPFDIPARQPRLWETSSRFAATAVLIASVHLSQTGGDTNTAARLTAARQSSQCLPARAPPRALDQMTRENGHISTTQAEFLLVRSSRI